MSLAGLGVVCIWHDLLPEARDEYHQWHNREHMPERVGIPGFRRGRRYVAIGRRAGIFQPLRGGQRRNTRWSGYISPV
jgi:hypothetical protein